MATAHPLQQIPDRLLSPQDLATEYGLSLTAQWRYRRQGVMPDPVRIGPRKVAWLESSILTWLKSQPLARLRSDEANG